MFLATNFFVKKIYILYVHVSALCVICFPASGGWQEQQNPNEKRVGAIVQKKNKIKKINK